MKTSNDRSFTTKSIKDAIKWLAAEVDVTVSNSGSIRNKLKTICNSKRVKNYTLPQQKTKITTILKAIAKHISYGSVWAEAIIAAINSTPATKKNQCLGWVNKVMQKAVGPNSYFGQSSAKFCYLQHKIAGKVHTSREIPTGAIVFGTGAGDMGKKHGHIGICYQGVDRSKTIIIADSVGGKVQKITLDAWIAQQEWGDRYLGYSLYEEISGKYR